MSEEIPLQFSPPQSSFNPSFWETLYEKKLNIYKLSNPSIDITPSYNISSNGSSGSVSFSAAAFQEPSSHNSLVAKLVLTDSFEEFTSMDKRALLEKISTEGLEAIVTGRALERPELLQRFALLVFADLKAYKFYYWFCHAAVTFPQLLPFRYRQLTPQAATSHPFKSHRFLSKMYGYMTLAQESSHVLASRYDVDKDDFIITPLSDAWDKRYEQNTCLTLLDMSPSPTSLGWAARSLLMWLSLYASQDPAQRSLQSDSSEIVAGEGRRTVRLLAVRNAKWRSRQNHTNTKKGSGEEEVAELVSGDESIFLECDVGLTSPLTLSPPDALRCFGWELNDRGKPGPRMADLSALLNTRLLMNQAVDLNLRLMKWRMWPTLQVDVLARKRCLLLGAGTLGCAVARCLMGWGVRHITLVDNGIVSFSNPVRQSLFEYDDCVARRFKSAAAAERLTRIFPDIDAKGVVMTIPMPGHPFAPPSTQTSKESGEGILADEAAVRELDALIRDHDYVFALTDSREARWLPTVISRAHDKPVINSALGFDSYLVMQQRGHFGCYFCNDIIAASNSRQGRPLDEQCTVTRPGLSLIAGGLCGEMFVALVHEEGEDTSDKDKVAAPHQIRGYLSDFSQLTLHGARFAMCTACSLPIVTRFQSDGEAFVRAVAEKPIILEELSGISQMTANIDVEACIDSDDDF